MGEQAGRWRGWFFGGRLAIWHKFLSVNECRILEKLYGGVSKNARFVATTSPPSFSSFPNCLSIPFAAQVFSVQFQNRSVEPPVDHSSHDSLSCCHAKHRISQAVAGNSPHPGPFEILFARRSSPHRSQCSCTVLQSRSFRHDRLVAGRYHQRDGYFQHQ